MATMPGKGLIKEFTLIRSTHTHDAIQKCDAIFIFIQTAPKFRLIVPPLQVYQSGILTPRHLL